MIIVWSLKGLTGLVGLAKLTLLITLLAICFSFVAFYALPAFAEGIGFLWTSDAEGSLKIDFAPGDITYIHGTGFTANSPIDITITRPDLVTESCNAVSCHPRFLNGLQTSDAEGDFVYNYNLNGIVGEYIVDATDGTISAQTTFTDSRTINGATLNGASSVIVYPSASITAAVTVTTTGGGSNNDWESTRYRIEGGSWVCVNTPDHTDAGTYTESFQITAPSSPGFYNVEFVAYDGNDCTASSPSSTLTLTDGIKVIQTNPTLPSSCGIDMVLIIDSSGSIDSTELSQMKTAFNGFVDAFLPNTPTQIAVVEFDSLAHLTQDYTSDVTSIKNAINSATSGGTTNWEDGLKEAYDEFDNRANKPDLYVFASDGNPNTIGDTYANSVTEGTAVAAAVTKATAIKLSGIRIVTLGIGNDLNPANLIAISSSDAYYSSDFSTLAETLATLADDLCGGTITVMKKVDGQPASGWTFSASVTGGSSTPATSTTSGDGFINPAFAIEVSGTTATVDVTETSQGGYGFSSAHCYKDQVEVGTPGQGTVTGIVIGKNDAIYCEFANTQVQCSSYTGAQACDEDPNCKWCSKCNTIFKNVNWPYGNCIAETAACQWDGCEKECGAACEINDDCQTMCVGNILNYNGICDSLSCSCQYSTQNCDDKDGLYDTGETRWVSANDCNEKEEKYQEYQDWYCCGSPGASLCNYDVIVPSGQWIPTGATRYKANGITCDGSPSGVCDVQDTCQSGQCVDNVAPGTTMCRASTGDCDVAEFCTGSGKDCPTDGFKLSSFVCRASAGVCDIAEACTGSSATCPTDVFNPSTTVCRSASGICDVVDYCTGSAAACPNDNVKPSTEICRASSGDCDVPENCDGSTKTCPVDVFKSSSFVCRASGGVCDPAEKCTGSSATCPSDAFNSSSTVCRASGGVCDPAEKCTGSAATCPNDAFNSSSTVCRASGGVCDPAEKCTGSTALCPSDLFNSSSTICRASAGVCDVADYCTGSAAACSSDVKSTAECRASADICDVAEVCNGINNTCPTDVFQPSSLVCRASGGVCDPAEKCTGSGPACPSDLFNSSSTVCRASAGPCDQTEKCTGSTALCPSDLFNSSSTVCRASAGVCDVTDYCTGSAAACSSDSKSTALCRASAGQCDVPENCDGVINTCPSDAKAPLSTPCDDGQYCSLTDHCDGYGSCVQLTARDCSGNDLCEIAQCNYIPDNFLSTFDYAPGFTSTCDETNDKCTNSSYSFTHTCADADSQDGGPVIPLGNGVRTCNAECDDFGTECQPHISGDYCYYDGSCNTNPASCACSYDDEYCPPSGTIIDGYCYWGERSCVNGDGQGGCTLNKDPMGCNDICDPVVGPKDSKGPDTLNVVAVRSCKKLNVTALVKNCNNIAGAEYYIDECGEPGTGIPLFALDGSFDESEEGVYKNNIDISLLADGDHSIFVRGKDKFGQWGPCNGTRFEVDQFPPIVLQQNITPQMACGGNPTITAYVCDDEYQSILSRAEYFIDIFNLPDGWGYPMQPVDGTWNSSCEWVTAVIDASGLSEGTHYVKVHAKDEGCNWGKLDYLTPVWFIRDTTTPETEKSVGDPKHACEQGENCDYYITQDTEITLTCYDFNPDDETNGGYNNLPGEYSDNVTIYWKYRVDGGAWNAFSQNSNSVTFKFPQDTTHELEYWCVDACGNSELKHTEIDIVDTQKPETVKTVSAPKVLGTGTIDWYITDETQIELTCTDPTPHPVDHVTLYWDIYYTQGECMPASADWGAPVSSGSEQGGHTLITGLSDSCHKIVYHCVDALGNAEAEKIEIDAVDNKAPVTTKNIIGPQYYNSTAKKLFIDGVTEIQLTCTDPQPHPVDNVTIWYRYRVNDGSWNSWTQYTSKFKFPEESMHELEYYCIDSLGNEETHQFEIDYVDHTKPVTTKTYGTPLVEAVTGGYPKWITSDTEITLTADDGSDNHDSGVADTYYRVTLLGSNEPCEDVETCEMATGSGTWNTYSSEFTICEESCHLIEYYSVDNVNKTEITKKQCVFVDNSAPLLEKQVGEPKVNASSHQHGGIVWDWFVNQSTPITLTCVDDNPHPVGDVTIYWYWWYFDNIDNTPWSRSQDFSYNGESTTFYFTEDSYHELVYWCEDALGNRIEKTEYDIVDTQVPETTKNIIGPQYYDSKAEKLYIDGVTEIELTCTDPGYHPVDDVAIWYRYRVDDGSWNSWTEYTGAFKFPEESMHTLEYYCVDALGNQEQTKTETDYVDHTKPVTTKTYGTPLVEAVTGGYPKWITSDTEITLTADDGSEVHSSGVADTYYRVTLLGSDEPCQDTEACEMAAGTGAWNTYVEPFTIGQESCHLIEYYSVDNVEKTEITKKQCVYVDNTPPVSAKSMGDPKHACTEAEALQYYQTGIPADGCYFITQSTPITITCSDVQPHPVDHVKIYYRDYLFGTTPPGFTEVDDDQAIITKNEDSAHILEWYCVDALGNTESTHLEYDIVDTQAPAITKSVGDPKITCDPSDPSGCDYWVRDHVTPIDLYCSDLGPHPVDHVSLWYRILLDGEVLQDWTDPTAAEVHKQIIFNEDSVHTLQYYCEDVLGNSDGTRNSPHEQVYRVDSTPPESTKLIVGPQYVKGTIVEGLWKNVTWVTSDTNFTLTSVDKAEPCAVGIDHFYVKLEWDSNCDGYVDTVKSEVDISGEPFQYKFNFGEECLHKITWYAVDKLGNAEAVHVQYHKVDNTPPHVLILKPVDGWYSDGEDIAVVAIAEDLTDPHGQCDMYSGMCSVGIADGTPCGAYFIDLLPDFDITQLESHMTYNAEAHECQGYVTIPEESGIPDGIVILAVTPQDNLGNEGDSLWEIYHTIQMNCGESPVDECIMNVVESIVAVWNLPRIGIDNTPPEVTITSPSEGYVINSYILNVSANVSDGDDGDVTSTITTGTPCFVTLGGVNIATLYYTANNDKCKGTIIIPEHLPQGNQAFGVEIADNAGNLGSDSVNVYVNTSGSGSSANNSDIAPPVILYTNPSGIINYSAVILEVETNEPATCYYGKEDNLSSMDTMTTSGANTTHSVVLGTLLDPLLDGLHVYSVQCNDTAGNMMDHSKTIVFYIDTTGSFALAIPDYGHYWSVGWNTFFLPERMLDDICGDSGPYYLEDILKSLDGSDPSYDMIWYFDGQEWFFNPHVQGYSTLTEFNDDQSLPYYIKMNSEDRLEIEEDNCQIEV